MIRASGTMITWNGTNSAARKPRKSADEPRNRSRPSAKPAIDPSSSSSATEHVTTITELRKYRDIPTLVHALTMLSQRSESAREKRSRTYSRRVFIATLAVNTSG